MSTGENDAFIFGPTLRDPEAADFVFIGSDGVKVLEFGPGSKIYVRGELVDDNQVIYRASCSWLVQAHADRQVDLQELRLAVDEVEKR